MSEAEPLSPWIAYPIAIGFFLALAVGAYLLWERTQRILGAYAARRGLRFLSEEQVGAAVPSHFALHESGRMGTAPGEFRYELTGERDGATVTLGLYYHTDPKTNGAKGYPPWVLLVDDPVLGLPHFYLQPTRWKHRLSKKARNRDIDFDESLDFSNWFQLESDDLEAVRQVFTRDLRQFLETRRGWHLEADGSVFAFYRMPHMFNRLGFNANRADALLEDSHTLRRLLRGRGK